MDLAGLAIEVVHGLAARGLTVSCAESCTGGQLAAVITSVPGASRIFPGGIVAYAESVKRALLEVPAGLLAEHGVVSAECAAAMARGCQHGFATDFALSTTGLAGPDGGTPEKPVGLVYFGWARAGGEVHTAHMQFDGDRGEIQLRSVEYSLRGLLDMLDEG
jgi:nicotinamide-nucleotide amidase